MSKSILPGDYTTRLNSYQPVGYRVIPGQEVYHIRGYARVTTTLQTAIDIKVKADNATDSELTGITIPSGAVVSRIAFRVPEALIATTGELLKVAAAVTDTTGYPSATAASSAIAAGAYRADTLIPSAAVGSNIALKLLSTNSGSAAAGTGVRVATNHKVGYVDIPIEVVYRVAGPVITIEDV
jgi:hypothetical protein